MYMVQLVAKDPLTPWFSKKHGYRGEREVAGQYETQILESSLEKVTALLRVGFGEAGAGIISTNLDIEFSSGQQQGVINALLPGIRVYAIFGFCDIHAFEESKEYRYDIIACLFTNSTVF